MRSDFIEGVCTVLGGEGTRVRDGGMSGEMEVKADGDLWWGQVGRCRRFRAEDMSPPPPHSQTHTYSLVVM